jgi:prevent-host-death family protein
MTRWQLQDAKARFSELVKASQEKGPQEITVRGEPVAVLLSRAEYDRLLRRKSGFLEFLRRSPLVGSELDLERDPSTTRDLDL